MNKSYYDYIVNDSGDIFDCNGNKIEQWSFGHGYVFVSLVINGKRRLKKVHRILAELFIPNDMNYPCVNHIDGNKTNNSLDNLEWCTYYHNNKHARDTKLNNISLSNTLRWNNSEFRERTSKKISKTHKERGISSGKRNPKFRYNIYKDDNEIDIIELSKIFNYSISYTYSIVKRFVDNNEFYNLFNENNITIIEGQQTIERIDTNCIE